MRSRRSIARAVRRRPFARAGDGTRVSGRSPRSSTAPAPREAPDACGRASDDRVLSHDGCCSARRMHQYVARGDVLCELARTDRHRCWLLEPDSDQTKALGALTRAREDLVSARVALASQLRVELERFWPGPLGLFSDIDSPISLGFLARYPARQTPGGWANSGWPVPELKGGVGPGLDRLRDWRRGVELGGSLGRS